MSSLIKFINNSFYKKKQKTKNTVQNKNHSAGPTKCIQELEFAFGYHFEAQY